MVVLFALDQYCIFYSEHETLSPSSPHKSLVLHIFNKTTWLRLHKTGMLNYATLETFFRDLRSLLGTTDKFRFTLHWTKAPDSYGNKWRLDT